MTGVLTVLQMVMVKAHCSHNQKHSIESFSNSDPSYPRTNSPGANTNSLPSLACPKVRSQSGLAHLEIIPSPCAQPKPCVKSAIENKRDSLQRMAASRAPCAFSTGGDAGLTSGIMRLTKTVKSASRSHQCIHATSISQLIGSVFLNNYTHRLWTIVQCWSGSGLVKVSAFSNKLLRRCSRSLPRSNSTKSLNSLFTSFSTIA